MKKCKTRQKISDFKSSAVRDFLRAHPDKIPYTKKKRKPSKNLGRNALFNAIYTKAIKLSNKMDASNYSDQGDLEDLDKIIDAMNGFKRLYL